jgi:hypothetical protein
MPRPTGDLPRTGLSTPVNQPPHTPTSTPVTFANASQPSASHLPTINELKQKLAAYFREKILRLKNENQGRVHEIKILSALLAVALEPSSNLDGIHVGNAAAHVAEWGSLDEGLDGLFDGEGKTEGRCVVERETRRIVPRWYQGRCVLTVSMWLT